MRSVLWLGLTHLAPLLSFGKAERSYEAYELWKRSYKHQRRARAIKKTIHSSLYFVLINFGPLLKTCFECKTNTLQGFFSCFFLFSFFFQTHVLFYGHCILFTLYSMCFKMRFEGEIWLNLFPRALKQTLLSLEIQVHYRFSVNFILIV